MPSVAPETSRSDAGLAFDTRGLLWCVGGGGGGGILGVLLFNCVGVFVLEVVGVRKVLSMVSVLYCCILLTCCYCCC